MVLAIHDNVCKRSHSQAYATYRKNYHTAYHVLTVMQHAERCTHSYCKPQFAIFI